MTQELVELLERVRSWPQERQDDVMHVLENMEEGGAKIYHMTASEEHAVQEGLDSELATDEMVAAARSRHMA